MFPEQKERRQALGSPMVDITNRPASASPRPSPKKRGFLRRRSSVSAERNKEDTRKCKDDTHAVNEAQKSIVTVESARTVVCDVHDVAEPIVEDVACSGELAPLDEQQQISLDLACPTWSSPLPVDLVLTRCSDTDPADQLVSRTMAQTTLLDRPQMRAQAKAADDERTPCWTQLRDVLDVILWASTILLVVGMVAIFYQITVRGHAHQVLFAVRTNSQLAVFTCMIVQCMFGMACNSRGPLIECRWGTACCRSDTNFSITPVYPQCEDPD